MAKNTDEIKKSIESKIIQTFQKDYITTLNNKIYIWGENNGEKIQIAISLTAPKTWVDTDNIPTPPVSSGHSFDDGWDFSDGPITPTPVKKAEVTPEETEAIMKMMEKLGL